LNKYKKNREKQKEKRQAKLASIEYYQRLRPLLLACAAWFIVLIVLHIPFIKDHMRSIMINFTQQSAVYVGKLLFLPMSAFGNTGLNYSGFRMNVILECTAYNFYVFAIMISFFSKWKLKDKLINLFLFLFSIFLANNLRFFVMGLVGKHQPQYFDDIHDYVWNILFGFLIFIIYYWADRRTGGMFAPAEAK
jgi:exosortase/archaeosortase family protein